MIIQGASPKLQSGYDFIVCGAGSSGSVIARRLAELPGANVLLIEAGGSDEVPEVTEAAKWRENVGSERDWSFQSEPNEGLNGRVVQISMGKVLGGGSSINAMGWMHGHKSDWDLYADLTGDAGWNYQSVKEIFRKIEDWQGPFNSERGTDGLLRIEQAVPSETTAAFLQAAASMGIPSFDDMNGRMRESDSGAALIEYRMHEGHRLSLFRDYVGPYIESGNLTVLTNTLVRRVLFEKHRAIGVEVLVENSVKNIRAGKEIVLSLGAINTPRVLMLSGVGDSSELSRVHIPILEHLPGVGRNLQEQLLVPGFVWERADTTSAVPFKPVVNVHAKSDPGLSAPDISCTQIDGLGLPPNLATTDTPKNAFSLMPAIKRPSSVGRVLLADSDPATAPIIQTNYLQTSKDLAAMLAAVQLARGLAGSLALKPFLKRETVTANLHGRELETFIRDNASIYWHESCTAKMGKDEMSVVDGQLKVYGVEGLRIADASVFPRIPTGLTMAPSVVVGERASELLRG